MTELNLDAKGKVISPSLVDFRRYITNGMSCVVKLRIDRGEAIENYVQCSMTPEQCRAMALNVLICADVIEVERPTPPQ